MDIPNPAEVEALGAHRGWPAVSILLATAPLGGNAAGDRAALGHLAREALREVAAAGAEPRLRRALAAPLAALEADDEFWARQASCLAVFATPEWTGAYRLPVRVAQSRVEVSDRFRLGPLLRAATAPEMCLVLALPDAGSGRPPRLLEVADGMPPRAVRVPGLPRAGAEGGGAASALAQRARALDRALRPVLAGVGAPLVLAAPEPMASAFRAVCTLPRLAAEGIALGGGPDCPDAAALAAAARRVVERERAAELRGLHELFRCRAREGRATADTACVARAATLGAVQALVVDLDAELSGTLGERDGRMLLAGAAGGVPAWCASGIADEIARRALRSGARVVLARRGELPGGAAEAAAILRGPL